MAFGLLATAGIIAACTGASATGTLQSPSPSARVSNTPATGSPSDQATASPSDQASYTPYETASEQPTPYVTPSPTHTPDVGPTPIQIAEPTFAAHFTMKMGKAAAAPAASDYGAPVGSAINAFGVDLLHQLDSGGNLCYSPTSVALALAMVEPGARGETATQMATVLHNLYSATNGPELIALLREFASQNLWESADGDLLSPDANGQVDSPPDGPPIAQLQVSNQAFAEKNLALQPDFLDALSSHFGAGVGLLDFRNNPEAARQAINKWASDRTYGKIPSVLQPGDVDNKTVIALANAIYFKANWEDPFDPSLTKPASFHLLDGTSAQVPMMASSDVLTAGYRKTADYQAVDIPYMNNTSMLVVMPKDINAFTTALSGQTFAGLYKWLSDYSNLHFVTLKMPSFATTTRTDLKQQLVAMGMPNAFDPQTADLSGIDGQRDIYLAKVIHQATIKVDEQGTTAAAVTVVLGVGTMGPGPNYPTAALTLDHPFLYFITDDNNGAILFMGRVLDPSQKS